MKIRITPKTSEAGVRSKGVSNFRARVCHNSPDRHDDVNSGAIGRPDSQIVENLDKPILVNNKKGVKANKRKGNRRPETNKI